MILLLHVVLTEVTWWYLAWAGQEGSRDAGSALPFPFLRPLCQRPTGGSGLQETKADQDRAAPLPKGEKRQSVTSAGLVKPAIEPTQV